MNKNQLLVGVVGGLLFGTVFLLAAIKLWMSTGNIWGFVIIGFLIAKGIYEGQKEVNKCQ